ncbi:hypothetical protein LTR78_010393 [Recurvomyces mirabilis]|uniref:HMA domain-containing protein n=1 Tax=Recurvomyces mirabilis TaxID=574656 RepID=A0AAE0TMX7_9PEZI|nr:hypothetical protein LTR78_010393 [Recurvomyces mirabilis]KAK5149772.1 hypothetical protein LTS14_010693 [Recurvomyces mirabilis]
MSGKYKDECSNTMLEANPPGECNDECCNFMEQRREADISASVCSTHLDAAFERFGALMKQQLCICRKVVEYLGFCCCLLSADGSLPGSGACSAYTAPVIETSKGKVPKAFSMQSKTCGSPSAPLQSTYKPLSRASSCNLRCESGCCAQPETDPCKNSYTGTSECETRDDDCCITIGKIKDDCCNNTGEAKDDCCITTEKAKHDCCTQTSKAKDDCCTDTRKTKGFCSDSVSETKVTGMFVHNAIDLDVEHSAAREHVVLKVDGMTCTSCGNKVKNVLDQIPGVYKTQVTFVSGTAAFELDTAVAHMADVVPLVEKRTGFKCSSVVDGYLALDLHMSPEAANTLDHSEKGGIVSIVREKAGPYRVTYDPFVIGARDLLPTGVSLAAPVAEAGSSKGKARLLRLTWYVITAAAFTIPVVVLNWAPNPVSSQSRGIISLVLASVVQSIAIPEFYTPALKALIFSRVVEMDMLVVIGVTAAYTYSVVAFALEESSVKLEQKAFFETSSLLITLVLFGRLLADIARAKAIRAVSLHSFQVESALLLQPDGESYELDSRLLQLGDKIIIPPHSRIVTDGLVTSGASAVDESMLTGEAVPVTRQAGDLVIAGTLNGEGSLHTRVTRLPGANSVSDIAKSVEKALAAKPRVQDLADRIASLFVPVAVTIAVIVFAIWIVIALNVRGDNGGGAVGTAITYAIAVLAISCPCALGLAVPMVLIVAGGVAAHAGVVIKASDILEQGFKITDIVFDKTGTLTKADLHVASEVILSNKATHDEALSIAKHLVKDDHHPVSKAVAAYIRGHSTVTNSVQRIKSVPGSGIQAEWDGHVVKAGSPFWLEIQSNVTVAQLLDQGMSCFCMTIDNVPVLALGVESILRNEARFTLDVLRSRNICTHIVSGDHHRAVEATARELDIANTASRQSPQQKRNYILKLQSNGKKVMFCGDGTNDAVALAQANVGVQLGTTSDVAGAVADVVLLGGLDGVVTLLDISKRAFRCVAFNFAWSGVYNMFAILLAAGAFVKVRVPPAYAGLGEIVSVGPVIMAAMSLLLGGKKRA